MNSQANGQDFRQLPGTDLLLPVYRRPDAFRAGQFRFPLGQKTYIMGILNVTPDSFSDGGFYAERRQALNQAGQMLADGADIIDIGGESTRPGYTPVSERDEIERVVPVIRQIIEQFGCPVSVDTWKPGVAEAALEAGACIINDINGLQKEPDLIHLAAQYGAGVIMMHNARLYRPDDGLPAPDLAGDMVRFLGRSIAAALAGKLEPDQLMLDPGIGFGVTSDESIAMITDLKELASFELPILVGPSRKRFIGAILDVPVDEREFGTAAAVAVSIVNGADLVRVHNVRAMTQVARVTDALCRCRSMDSRGDR